MLILVHSGTTTRQHSHFALVRPCAPNDILRINVPTPQLVQDHLPPGPPFPIDDERPSYPDDKHEAAHSDPVMMLRVTYPS